MDLNRHQNKCVIEYNGTVGIWVIVGCREALDTVSLRDSATDAIRLFVCLCGCMLQVMVDLIGGHR